MSYYEAYDAHALEKQNNQKYLKDANRFLEEISDKITSVSTTYGFDGENKEKPVKLKKEEIDLLKSIFNLNHNKYTFLNKYEKNIIVSMSIIENTHKEIDMLKKLLITLEESYLVKIPRLFGKSKVIEDLSIELPSTKVEGFLRCITYR